MCACCGDITPTLWRYVSIEGKEERCCNGTLQVSTNEACALYYQRHGKIRPISTTTRKKRHVRQRKKKEEAPEEEVTPSSPPPRELMSEIDHPLLSEGICLPRMGYLRDGEETDEEKENVEPDDMERFFSDILA
jgi:hypothetical protein